MEALATPSPATQTRTGRTAVRNNNILLLFFFLFMFLSFF